MTRATILQRGIDDDLWPEVVIAMSRMKNVCLTRALEEKTPHQAQFLEEPSARPWLYYLGLAAQRSTSSEV